MSPAGASLETLIEQLGSADVQVQERAIAQLRASDDPEAQNALISALADERAAVGETARRAVKEIDDERAVPGLIGLLHAPHHDDLMETVTNCLLRIARAHGRSLVEYLPSPQLHTCLQVVLKSSDREARLLALEEICSAEAPSPVAVLLEALADRDEVVSLRVKEVLINLATSTTDQISAALKSAAPRVGETLLDIIAATGNSRFVGDVLTFAENDDPYLREKAALALGKIGDQFVVTTLTELASDSSAAVRAAACNALGWIGGDTTLDCLFAGLEDKNATVQLAALGALVLIGTPRVIARFKDDISGRNLTRQKLATKALGWIGEEGVVEPLLQALNHVDWQVRRLALESLGRIGVGRAFDAVAAAVRDQEPKVRQAAVEALLEMEDARSGANIAYLLEDEDLWVKYQALHALGRLGAAEFMEQMVPFLSNNNEILRAAAATALARLNDQGALPFLRKILDDESPEVVGAVRNAINSLEALPDGEAQHISGG